MWMTFTSCQMWSFSLCRWYMSFCQHKDSNKIENQLNEDFCNICDWFLDNKLSIHFDEDKTKSILFAFKFKRKNTNKRYIKYGDIQIKQHSKVKYLGCLLNARIAGEAMALYIFVWLNRNDSSSNFLLPIQLQKSLSTVLRSPLILIIRQFSTSWGVSFHHIYNLHSHVNQHYAWSLHINHDQTVGDWAVPIDFV